MDFYQDFTNKIVVNSFIFEFISSRGTNSQSLLLGGFDAALIAYQLVVLSGSLCSV